MMREKFAKYEAILGCKVNSDEFNRRVDATIAAMNNRKV